MWAFRDGDLLLRSRRGGFSILTGHFQAETLIDAADLLLWRFDPLSGDAHRYTSEYAYQQLIDGDGRRETTVPSVISLSVDALGHRIAFHPASPAPPYRTWFLEDGAGRRYRLELEDVVTFLDGNLAGALAKSYVASRVVDETAAVPVAVDYAYSSGRLVHVHHPGMVGNQVRSYTYEYDDRGALTQITDPVGDQLRIRYVEDAADVDDRLIPRYKVACLEDGDGNRLEYTYNSVDRLCRVRIDGPMGDARELECTYIQDDQDTQQRFVAEQSTIATKGLPAPQTATTRWHYSSDGRFTLDAVTDPIGAVTAFEYNDYNQLTALVDPLGHRREQAYDVSSAPTPANPNRYDLIKTSENVTDSDGHVAPVVVSLLWARYDAQSSPHAADANHSSHRLESHTDPRGNTSTFSYDDAGNGQPLQPTRMVDPLGHVTVRLYDDRGAVVSEEDPEGNVWAWSFDNTGRLKLTTDPNGGRRSWGYDPATGWLLIATDALGVPGDPARSKRFEWNPAGRRVRDIDAVGAVTEYRYDASSRIAAITQYDPAARTTRFRYDASGELVELEDPSGTVLMSRYDEAGRMYQLIRPTGKLIAFARDPAGRVTSMTDANGAVTRYEYDALGRLVRVVEPPWPATSGANPGKNVDIIYDELSRRLRVSDSELGADYAYHYDTVGNLTSRDAPDGSQLRYSYDARNDLLRLYDDDGVIDLGFERDDAARVTSVRDSSLWDPSRTFKFVRSQGGLKDNLYAIAYDASGIRARFDYDADRQLTRVLHSTGAVADRHLRLYLPCRRPDWRRVGDQEHEL